MNMERADHVGVHDGNTLLLRKRGCRRGCHVVMLPECTACAAAARNAASLALKNGAP